MSDKSNGAIKRDQTKDSCNRYAYTTDDCGINVSNHLLACSLFRLTLLPRLHKEAYMKHTYSIHTCTTCARSLLHVCFVYVSCTLSRVNEVLHVHRVPKLATPLQIS